MQNKLENRQKGLDPKLKFGNNNLSERTLGKSHKWSGLSKNKICIIDVIEHLTPALARPMRLFSLIPFLAVQSKEAYHGKATCIS